MIFLGCVIPPSCWGRVHATYKKSLSMWCVHLVVRTQVKFVFSSPVSHGWMVGVLVVDSWCGGASASGAAFAAPPIASQLTVASRLIISRAKRRAAVLSGGLSDGGRRGRGRSTDRKPRIEIEEAWKCVDNFSGIVDAGGAVGQLVYSNSKSPQHSWC